MRDYVGDIAVVGAGPLGIVTALELADSGYRVVLIESGHRRFDRAVQALGDEPRSGNDMWHVSNKLAMRRQLGGTSVLWGGRCVPFDPIDFAHRAYAPNSDWPLSYDEFASFLPDACAWSVCGAPDFSATTIAELCHRQLVAGLPDGDVLSTNLERWSLPTRFNREYGGRLRSHPRVVLVTGYTCTRIACHRASGAVAHLDLRSLSAPPATATARHYVIATGGLEATRLLLNSDDIHRRGIGNHSGHLGRWYMAHVEARVAEINLNTPWQTTVYGHERDSAGVYVRRRFTVSPAVQDRDELLNAAVWLVNPNLSDPTHGSGILSGVYLTLASPAGKYLLAEAIRQAHIKPTATNTVRAHLANVTRDLGPTARFAGSFAWQRLLKPGRKAPGFFVPSRSNVYPLHYHGEHLASSNSYVELAEERDALGMRRLRTHLRYSDADIANVKRTLDHIDAHLRAHSVGSVRLLAEDVPAATLEYLAGSEGFHQTGTTRMSASPEQGVVDRNLTVHNVPNLSVASTSTFPSSSQANPTLTGIAFAVRLSRHLSGLLHRNWTTMPNL